VVISFFKSIWLGLVIIKLVASVERTDLELFLIVLVNHFYKKGRAVVQVEVAEKHHL
jgi:hypothetical protein